MNIKELSNKVLELIQNGDKEAIIPFMIENLDQEINVPKALISVQVQLKEIGGGYPPIGKQITTINEIIEYTSLAVEKALELEDKLTYGKLFHNQASFCFPNMDDGVEKALIEPGYYAAVKDYEIRKEIGDKGPMLWAKWLVGICEFIRGDINQALSTLEDTAKQANEAPIEKDIDTWTRLMIAKFYLKSKPDKRDLALEMLEEVQFEFNSVMDRYGLETVEQIIKTYF